MSEQSTQDPPLVTFALFAYNQEQYVREAIEGAFAQTYEPLEIILSDDCSTDRTFEIMQEMAAAYRGRHTVRVRQNEINLGIGPHVNKVINDSNGTFIAFAAGDDISKPDRISHSLEIISQAKNQYGSSGVYSILSTLTYIDEYTNTFGESIAPNRCINKFNSKSHAQVGIFCLENLINGELTTSGPSRIISKRQHELFGDINSDCFTEDIIYLFRTVLSGFVLYSNKSDVFYRKHRENLSSPYILYKKSFSGVEKQLRSDLEIAIKRNMISENEGILALKWINDNKSFRAFYRAKVEGFRPKFKDLITLLKANHLSVRRKFGIIREYLGVR